MPSFKGGFCMYLDLSVLWGSAIICKAKFVKGVEALDAKRKTNFMETFPELVLFYQSLRHQ